MYEMGLSSSICEIVSNAKGKRRMSLSQVISPPWSHYLGPCVMLSEALGDDRQT